MKRFLFFILICVQLPSYAQNDSLHFYQPDHPQILYTGRIDFSDPKRPKFWQPGVYVEWSFEGSDCRLILEDEVLWGNSHNYIELVVDGKERRLQLRSKIDTIEVAKDLSAGIHHVRLYKNTEAGIGYLALVGIRCSKMIGSPSPPERKIEFIGNSITSGMGSDQTEIPCGKGVWYDQHNAYKSYGAITARKLNAQFHLSSVSGIGLMHSCCEMKVIMPQVFDKINMREDAILWDFKRYQPDVVTVCLGQNDGIQDSVVFRKNYIRFLKTLRGHYPGATIICLTSPMADADLILSMKRDLTAIVKEMNLTDKNILKFFFSKRYNNGCGDHPSLEDHAQISAELILFLEKTINWK